AVADHLLPARSVPQVRAAVQVGGDLGLDGLGEQPRRSPAEDVGQHVPFGDQWQGVGIRGSVVHGGVLRCLVGRWVGLATHPGYAAFFKPSSTTFDHSSWALFARAKYR